MRFLVGSGLLLLVGITCVNAQWQMLTSNTTADLRGIHNVGNGVAWASGTNGTVLRTEDGGYVWQTCTIPPGAEKLDFRGIQAFDANTAIVMSSGKGDLSRLYKTMDGCHTWKLLQTNSNPDGFWDALVFQHADFGYYQMPNVGILLGDPINGDFDLSMTMELRGEHPRPVGEAWFGFKPHLFPADRDDAVFAASNSSAVVLGFNRFMFGTGGKSGARIVTSPLLVSGDSSDPPYVRSVPLGSYTESSGVFSLFASDRKHLVAVGGDYLKPDDSSSTAVFTVDGGKNWQAAKTPPHGYRSSVAYDEKTKTWITVGPNGTDISTDDGKNWRAIHPNPALHEAPDADRNWNAISLPYVVGPKGRIGKLDEGTLK